jgi:hypothetical protein
MSDVNYGMGDYKSSLLCSRMEYGLVFMLKPIYKKTIIINHMAVHRIYMISTCNLDWPCVSKCKYFCLCFLVIRFITSSKCNLDKYVSEKHWRCYEPG